MNGNITGVNTVAEKLTGWDLTDARGQAVENILHIVHAKTRQDVPNPVRQALAEDKIIGLANHTVLIARDGTEYQIADAAPHTRCRRFGHRGGPGLQGRVRRVPAARKNAGE